MNRYIVKLVFYFLFLALFSPVQAQTPTVDLSKVYDAALEGDMVKAFSILDSIDSNQLSTQDVIAADCMRKTFTIPSQAENLPPLSQKILSAYRNYWQTLMLKRLPVKDTETKLLASLNIILNDNKTTVISSTNLDDASERAKKAIEREGLFALTGITSPYYELMIWKTQSPKNYRVMLHERNINVHVVFLDDFVSLGWAGFATCDRYHSGGWTTEDSLFALKSAYNTKSEEFLVSYLSHEARHFSDQKKFPKLQQPELEYRAKLTEIVFSKKSTHDLIIEFARRAGQNRSVPHHFADYWVAKNLSGRVFNVNKLVREASKWRNVSANQLRTQAKYLLKQNDVHLRRIGQKSVERFLATIDKIPIEGCGSFRTMSISMKNKK